MTITPLPSSIELIGGGGGDMLTARGGFGSGQVFAGGVTLRAGDGGDTLTGSDFDDLIVGAAGVDTVAGYGGNDEIRGEGGNDHLSGHDGNDLIIGGAGADSFVGSNGNDTFQATDGQADTILSGGAGIDTAFFDAALDPAPVASRSPASAVGALANRPRRCLVAGTVGFFVFLSVNAAPAAGRDRARTAPARAAVTAAIDPAGSATTT